MTYFFQFIQVLEITKIQRTNFIVCLTPASLRPETKINLGKLSSNISSFA